jgi:hypothetical protein
MKKLILSLCFLGLIGTVFAQTSGKYNQTVNGAAVFTAVVPARVFVFNAGTNVIYAAFGGYSVAATNDPITYHANRMPIRPAASYTTVGKYSVVTVYCETNGLVDVGFEGVE